MKKMIVRIASAAVAAALVAVALGCGSTKTELENGRPKWVANADTMDDDNLYYATASAKTSSFQLSLDTARLRARAELARKIGTRIQAAQQDLLGQYDPNDPNSLISGQTSAAVSNTDQYLVGSKQIDMYEDPKDGTVYVLMCVSKDEVVQAFNKSAGLSGRAELTKQMMEESYQKMTAGN